MKVAGKGGANGGVSISALLWGILLGLSLAANPVLAQTPKSATSVAPELRSYRQGATVLRKDPREALGLCAQGTAAPYLADWAHLCRAKAFALLGEKESTSKELKMISPLGAANLHGDALWLSLTPVTEGWRQEVKSLALKIKRLNLSELRGEVAFLNARESRADGSLAQALNLFQSVRELSPRSSLAVRARLEEREIVASPTAKLPKDGLKDFDSFHYWMKEISLAEKEGEVRESAVLAQRLLTVLPASLPASDRVDLLKLSWRLQAASGEGKRATLERKKIQGDLKSPLRPLLIADEALSYWRESNYDKARAALAYLSPENPERLFIEARLAEIDRDFDQAVSGYRRVVKSSSSQRSTAALRLLWLLVSRGEWVEANSLSASMEAGGYDIVGLDKEGVTFWHRLLEKQVEGGKLSAKGASMPPLRGFTKDRGEPDLANSIANIALNPASAGPLPLQDFPSVYFWRSRGFSLAEPLKDRADVSVRFCKSGEGELPAVPEVVKSLVQMGARDLASQEIRVRVAKTETIEDLLTRARLLARFALPADAWSEIRARKELPAAYFGECGGNLLSIIYPTPYLDVFRREAKATNVPVALALALSRSESAFNPNASSSAGALGIMQLMPATAKMEGLAGSAITKAGGLQGALLDPETNILYGVRHLRGVIESQGGQWHYAIASYNAGKRAVGRWVENHPNQEPLLWTELVPYKETRDYVKRVLSAYWVYEWLLAERRGAT